MKVIMMSIRPQHVVNILNGLKTLEIRKKFPKDYVGWVYIYVTKGKPLFVCKDHKGIVVKLHDSKKNVLEQLCVNGKVIARFWCDKVEKIHSYLEPEQWYMTSDLGGSGLLQKSCLSFKELDDYLLSGEGYAIHITKLEIFDKPKEIKEFYKVGYGECAKPQGSLREQIIENYNNALKYQLTRAPESWCYVEI